MVLLYPSQPTLALQLNAHIDRSDRTQKQVPTKLRHRLGCIFQKVRLIALRAWASSWVYPQRIFAAREAQQAGDEWMVDASAVECVDFADDLDESAGQIH